MNMKEAFEAFNEGRHLTVKLGGTIYKDVLIKELHVGDGSAVLMLPTPIGEPDRMALRKIDDIELLP